MTSGVATPAWPSAEIAVMDANGAANILLRRELAAAEDPAAVKAQWDQDYAERFANPYPAAERGYVDDVIDPRDTRRVLAFTLSIARESVVRPLNPFTFGVARM